MQLLISEVCHIVKLLLLSNRDSEQGKKMAKQRADRKRMKHFENYDVKSCFAKKELEIEH